MLLFDDEGNGLARIEHFDAEARLQSALSVGNAEDGEVLRAAVQIGPGRYVLAGIRRASENGQSGIVALRYDLDATGGRVVWQRRLVAGNGADVLAAVASGDGGLVLSAWAAEGGAPNRVGQLLKLDGDGRLQWHAALPGPGNVLQRMPDGGYAALSFAHLDTMPRVTRLSAAGAVLWQNSVSLDDLGAAWRGTWHPPPTAACSWPEGHGARISLVRLAADGSLASAVDLQLPGTSHLGFEDLRLRQTPDGGFVLALSESGLLEAIMARRPCAPLPRGQSNVLVLKLDAGLRPSVSHVYGGLFDEGVRDLLLRAERHHRRCRLLRFPRRPPRSLAPQAGAERPDQRSRLPGAARQHRPRIDQRRREDGHGRAKRDAGGPATECAGAVRGQGARSNMRQRTS